MFNVKLLMSDGYYFVFVDRVKISPNHPPLGVALSVCEEAEVGVYASYVVWCVGRRVFVPLSDEGFDVMF